MKVTIKNHFINEPIGESIILGWEEFPVVSEIITHR